MGIQSFLPAVKELLSDVPRRLDCNGELLRFCMSKLSARRGNKEGEINEGLLILCALACCRFRGHHPKLTAPSFRTPWTHAPERRVLPLGIVEALDVVEHVDFRLVSCSARVARGSLGL